MKTRTGWVCLDAGDDLAERQDVRRRQVLGERPGAARSSEGEGGDEAHDGSCSAAPAGAAVRLPRHTGARQRLSPARAGLLPARRRAVDEVRRARAPRCGERAAVRHGAVDVDEHDAEALRPEPLAERAVRRRVGVGQDDDAALLELAGQGLEYAICCTNFGSSGSSAKMTTGRLPLSSARLGVGSWAAAASGASARTSPARQAYNM